MQNVVKGMTRKREEQMADYTHAAAKCDQEAKEINQEIFQIEVFKFSEADEGKIQRRDADTKGRNKTSGEEKFKGLKTFPQSTGNG